MTAGNKQELGSRKSTTNVNLMLEFFMSIFAKQQHWCRKAVHCIGYSACTIEFKQILYPHTHHHFSAPAANLTDVLVRHFSLLHQFLFQYSIYTAAFDWCGCDVVAE